MKTYRATALLQAISFIGTKESPPNSNHGPRIDLWCKRCVGVAGGFPWCAAFIWCMFDNAGLKLVIRNPALVQGWVTWARVNKYTVNRPLRGDVVCYDWNSDGTRDHVGIVERVLALRWTKDGKFIGWIRAIEGNTSLGNDSNGGEVMRRWRWVNDFTVFIRVPGTHIG